MFQDFETQNAANQAEDCLSVERCSSNDSVMDIFDQIDSWLNSKGVFPDKPSSKSENLNEFKRRRTFQKLANFNAPIFEKVADFDSPASFLSNKKSLAARSTCDFEFMLDGMTTNSSIFSRRTTGTQNSLGSFTPQKESGCCKGRFENFESAELMTRSSLAPITSLSNNSQSDGISSIQSRRRICTTELQSDLTEYCPDTPLFGHSMSTQPLF